MRERFKHRKDLIIENNDLLLPIDFRSLSETHKVRKGTIYYSETFDSWVIRSEDDDNGIRMICIKPPFDKGERIEGMKGELSRFNGMEIKNVTIKANRWCASF